MAYYGLALPFSFKFPVYDIYLMYSDSQTWANSVDSDEMPQKATSHQGLHCLPLIMQFLDTPPGRHNIG